MKYAYQNTCPNQIRFWMLRSSWMQMICWELCGRCNMRGKHLWCTLMITRCLLLIQLQLVYIYKRSQYYVAVGVTANEEVRFFFLLIQGHEPQETGSSKSHGHCEDYMRSRLCTKNNGLMPSSCTIHVSLYATAEGRSSVQLGHTGLSRTPFTHSGTLITEGKRQVPIFRETNM